MRLPEREHECSYCGASLDIAPNTEITVRLWATTDTAIIRSLLADGTEFHACEIMPGDGRPLAEP